MFPGGRSGRADALQRWWSGLGAADRASARAVAAEDPGGELPTGLVVGLVRAGVLVVSHGYFVNTSPGSAGFPLPADVRDHVLAQP